jgi:HD-GYP domain-containing protein (c-di-GMP phosphodiesterase class II)
MNTAKLDCPVHTLDDRLLLSAGKELTSEALDELIATNKDTSYQALSFLEYGTVYQDILRLIQKPPYHVIFDELKKTLALNLMEKISFIPPILESLDLFEERDFYTYRHSLVVFAMSTIMARDLLEKSEDWIMEIMAGTIHDLGKISIPIKILKKDDPLTGAEKRILEHHTLAGFVLLCYYLKDRRSFAAQVAKEHHERRDGSGYPLGISLRDRMVEIIAACDVYDALLSPRPFRPTPYDNRTALEEITEMAKMGKLSLEVVQTLVSHNRKDRPHFRECKVSTEKRGIPPEDNLYGVIVKRDPKEEIKCPNCHGSCIKREIPKEDVEYISYECSNCGKEFDKDDLLNIEMGKHFET